MNTKLNVDGVAGLGAARKSRNKRVEPNKSVDKFRRICSITFVVFFSSNTGLLTAGIFALLRLAV